MKTILHQINTHMTLLCFRDGAFIPKHQLTLSTEDLGFSRGYALFETCRTYFKIPFHLREHYIRMVQGARHLALRMPYSYEEFAAIIQHLIEHNPAEELGFRIYLTAGLSSDGFTSLNKESFFIIPYFMTSYNTALPQTFLHLKTTQLARAFPYYKTTFYLPGLLAKKLHAPCDDILFVDEENHLLESTTAGFLAFIDGSLVMPLGPRLTSVTQEVLTMLAKNSFGVEYRPLSYEELPKMRESFLCSTTRELVPVGQIDAVTIGTETALMTHLKQLLTDYIQKKQWPLLETFYEEASLVSAR